MAEGFPTIAGGISKGAQQATGQAVSLMSMRETILARRQQMQMQERQEKWTKSYQKAALGVQIASNKDLPASMRLKGLNNGLLPLWNDPSFDVEGNNATPLPEFTEADLENDKFKDVLARAKSIGASKDLTPKMRDKAIVELFADYHASRGETAEAMKMIMEGEKQDNANALAERRIALGERALDLRDKQMGGQGGKPLPSDKAEKLALIDQMKQQLQDVRASYDKSFVGPVKGRTGALAQTTGIGATKERAKFLQTIASVRNQILNLRSGAAITPQEAERLLKELPTETRSGVDFESGMDNFDLLLDRMKDTRLKSFEAAGFNVSKFGGTSAPTSDPMDDLKSLGLVE